MSSNERPKLSLPDWFRYDVLLHGRCGKTLAEHPMPHAAEASCPFPALPPREFRQAPDACSCGEAWSGHPEPHALTCGMHGAAVPQEGDRVRLTYGDGSTVEGTWRAVLEKDDGTLHTHTRGQVRRDVLPSPDESLPPSA